MVKWKLGMEWESLSEKGKHYHVQTVTTNFKLLLLTGTTTNVKHKVFKNDIYNIFFIFVIELIER